MDDTPRRDTANDPRGPGPSVDPKARPAVRGSSVWQGLATHPIGALAGGLAGVLLGILIGLAMGPVGSLFGAVAGGVVGALLGGGMPAGVGRQPDDPP
ncbi:hypothetical protein [Ideonella sp.]|uniref:hypothetical protein n=1 Tax=Ideonella sp. TaxID=1929293 RepID=UPI0035AFB384